jgi:hypothetical protein
MSGRFHVKFSFSEPVILEKILRIFSLYKHVKTVSLLWPHPTPGAMILTNLLLY